MNMHSFKHRGAHAAKALFVPVNEFTFSSFLVVVTYGAQRRNGPKLSLAQSPPIKRNPSCQPSSL
jgi:hypothetical protein